MCIVFLLTTILCSMQNTTHTLKELHWLNGSWMMETKRGKVYEHWTIDSDTQMSAKVFFVSESDSTLSESIMLKQEAGGVFYIPTVTDQNEGKSVRFGPMRADGDAVVFENKQHDFPQRIFYRKFSNDNMLAWIEGEIEGKTKRSEFPYVRAK